MKKISILFLSFIALLFLSVYLAPSVYADIPSGEVAINLTVVEGEGPGGIVVDYPPINAPYGNTIFMNPSGLEEYTEKDFAFYIHNGQRITNSSAPFLVSGSTHLVVVLKSPGEVVAAFVDTNGKLLDVQYNAGSFTPTYGGATPTKPGYAFTGFGSLGSISNDTVFVAQYERANEGPVAVTVNGGTADPAEPIYNDVVTLTPGAGDFSYWADEDGQIVSTKADYAFTALQPVELTAVFDVAFTAEPLVYLNNVTGIRDDYQSFLGYVEFDAEDYTLVEYGLLASEISEVLNHDTSGVTVIPSTALAPTNEFLRSFEEGEFTSFRAYAIFSDGENQIVKYSDNNFYSKSGTAFETNFESIAIAYADTTKEIGGQTWTLNQTFATSSDANDKKNGVTSLRFRSNYSTSVVAHISSAFTVVGLSKVEFQYAWYSNHVEGRIFVSVSKDNTTWVDVVSDLTPTATLQLASIQIDYLDAALATAGINDTTALYLRIRVENTSTGNTGNRSTNIDDLKLFTEANTKLYSVTYSGDGAETLGFESVAKGSTALLNPPSEVPFGHEFAGWYTNAEFIDDAFDSETPIHSHIILYAKFDELEQFTVSFDTHGGTGTFPDQEIYSGDYAEEPESDPGNGELIFLGWFTQAEGGTLFVFESTPITTDITLHAQWSEEEPEPVEVLLHAINFENGTNSNIYPGHRDITLSGIPQLHFYKGNVVNTGNPLTGSFNAMFRIPAANSDETELYFTNNLNDASITSVKFNANMAYHSGSITGSLNVYYRLSEGEWVLFKTFNPTPDKTAYEVIFTDISGIVNIKFGFVYASAVTGNRDSKIDDIEIWGYDLSE